MGKGYLICLLTSVLIFFTDNLFSQVEISFELSGGVNNNYVFLVQDNKPKYRGLTKLLNIKPYFHYSSGLNIQYHVGTHYSIVSGLGFDCNSYRVNYNKEYIVKNYFLKIPIFIKYHFNKQLNIKAGIENSFFVENSENLLDDMSTYNFSVIIGVGYKLIPKMEISTNIYSDFTPFNKIELINSSQGSYNAGAFLNLSYIIFKP